MSYKYNSMHPSTVISIIEGKSRRNRLYPSADAGSTQSESETHRVLLFQWENFQATTIGTLGAVTMIYKLDYA